jgi:hypothetical protein
LFQAFLLEELQNRYVFLLQLFFAHISRHLFKYKYIIYWS